MRATAAVILVAVTLTGCHGRDSSAAATTLPVLTGLFIDGPVEGLAFSTQTQSGITNSAGAFFYRAGEDVTFSIGAVIFPSVTAAALITPLSFGSGEDIAAPIVANIARLLQSLDTDCSPANGITIAPDALPGVPQLDFASPDFHSQLDGTFDPAGDGCPILLTVRAALDHLEEELLARAVPFVNSAGGQGTCDTALAPSGLIALADGSLYVANPESGVVSVIDTGSDTLVDEIGIGGAPASLAIHPCGDRLFVSTNGPDELVTINPRDLSIALRVPLTMSPHGVVVAPEGDSLFVAGSATDVIEVLDLRSFAVTERLSVSPRPKGLAISRDGSRLFVTHFLTGDITVIDTSTLAIADVIATGLDSNFARKIALNPTDDRAYLPHVRSNVGNPNLLFDSTVFPVVSAIDTITYEHLPGQRLDLSVVDRPVNLPFDVAFSPDGSLLYVVNLGSGDVSVISTDSRTGVAHIEVGDVPRAIAITPSGDKGYVLNSLSYDVSVLDLSANLELLRIPLSQGQVDTVLERGKLLFFSSRSTRISRDQWMSCATCHFEGGHDGRTWQFTDGPRNTTSLRGLSETRPLHWSADRDEVQDFESTIRQLQAGTGLIDVGAPSPALGAPNAGLSEDLDALAAFVESLAPIPSPYRNPDGSPTAAAVRGQAVFERPDVGCSSCHSGPRFTDSSLAAAPFVTHDVGTGDGPDEMLGPAFDTPTLLGIWDTAPYLHDGSAATLEDVLVSRNPGDLHGTTSHLSDAERADLVAYLQSL